MGPLSVYASLLALLTIAQADYCKVYKDVTLRMERHNSDKSDGSRKSKTRTMFDLPLMGSSLGNMACECSKMCRDASDMHTFWSLAAKNDRKASCTCLSGSLRNVSASKAGKSNYAGPISESHDERILKLAPDLHAPCKGFSNRATCRSDPACQWARGLCGMRTREQNAERVDIAVVGAGTSGLYMALRLKEEHPNKNIKVYEMLPRVGGRFWSPMFIEPWADEIDNEDRDIQQFHFEMGGMRYTKEHWRLNTLFKKMDMCGQRVNFAFGHGDIETHMPWFLRGTSGEWDWRNITRSYEDMTVDGLYNLPPHESARSPDDLLVKMKALINELNGLDAKAPMDDATHGEYFPQRWLDWFNKVEVAGRSLYDWNFEALLHNLGLSDEALMFIMDMYGFTTTFIDDVSGAWGMLSNLGDFGNADAAPFHTVCGGMQQLPLRLAKALQEKDDDFLRLQHKLNEIDALHEDHEAKFVLRFDDLKNEEARSVEVMESVILAFPPNMVEKLIPETPWERNEEVEELFTATIDEKLHKINLMFDKKWWLDQDEEYWMEEGGVYTSLVCGTLYVEKIWENDEMGVVTFYFDGVHAHVWDSLQDQAEPCENPPTDEDMETHNFGIGESPCGYYDFHFDYDVENWGGQIPNRASNAIVDGSMRAIAKIFKRPLEEFPMPVAAFYSPWGTDLDFGASCFQYKRTANIQDVTDRVHQPDPTLDIYYASSGVSVLNEWVEGGLVAADNVLTRGFGLAPMSSDEDCPFDEEHCRCSEPAEEEEEGHDEAGEVLEFCRDEDFAKSLYMYYMKDDKEHRNPIFGNTAEFNSDLMNGNIGEMDPAKGHMFN